MIESAEMKPIISVEGDDPRIVRDQRVKQQQISNGILDPEIEASLLEG